MSIANVRGGLSQSEPSIILNTGAADQLTVTHPANNTAARVLTYPDQDYDYSLPAVKHGGDTTKDVVIDTSGATTAKTVSFVSSHTDNRTLTLPDATDTLVGRATTDTLTNKTLTAPIITGATIAIPDTDSSHNLTLTWNEAEAASDRVLNFLVNGAARTIDLTGNITIAANLTTTIGAVTLVGNVAGSSITLPTTGTAAVTADKLSVFAATTSAELAGVISDETGSGALAFATSPTLVTPVLGTPSSGTLTSCTGLPIATGVSGLGTNVGTFLATPSSANLASALTDETGSGLVVFATSPVLTTPTITTGGSIDVSGAGTLTIGASMGANALTLGGATSNVAVLGDFSIGAGKNMIFNDLAEARFEDTTDGEYVGLKAPTTVSASIVFELPDADGSTGQVLKTDGALALGWVSPLANPMTTQGDIIIGGASGATTRLAAVTDNRVVRGDGTNVVSGQIDDPTFFTSGAKAATSTPGIVEGFANDVSDTNLASGIYTPTKSGAANNSGGTVGECQYMRVGNIVSVAGVVTGVTITTTGLAASFKLTLPVATANFSSASQGNGTSWWSAAAGYRNAGYSFSANGTQLIQITLENTSIPNATGGVYVYFTFQYEIQ